MWSLIIGSIISLVFVIMIGSYKYISSVNISGILLKADIKIVPVSKDNKTEFIPARSWDITIHDDRAYDDFMSGTLGFMESYMKGYWSCYNLEDLFRKLEKANLHNLNIYTIPELIYLGLNRLRIKIMGFTEKAGELVGLQHYDLPHQLYETMLGPSMTYSCAYFKDTDDLDKAQVNKMDLIARKMKLKPHQKVLDIGCGWGTLAYHLVKNYKVKVVAITISKEQFQYCQEKYRHPDLTFKLMDYRNLNYTDKFDRIVSVGMFEHVTSANFDIYFTVCQRVLKPNGLFLLHTITGDKSQRPGEGNPFIMKYIFPNSQLPSLSQITQAASYKFVVEDVHNFGLYYAKTLRKWIDNFDMFTINDLLLKDNKPTLEVSFTRMWHAYLTMSQIGFDTNKIFLHQIVLSRNQDEVYEACR